MGLVCLFLFHLLLLIPSFPPDFGWCFSCFIFPGGWQHHWQEGRDRQTIQGWGEQQDDDVGLSEEKDRAPLTTWFPIGDAFAERGQDQHQRRFLSGEDRDADGKHGLHLQGIHAHLQQIRGGKERRGRAHVKTMKFESINTAQEQRFCFLPRKHIFPIFFPAWFDLILFLAPCSRLLLPRHHINLNLPYLRTYVTSVARLAIYLES